MKFIFATLLILCTLSFANAQSISAIYYINPSKTEGVAPVEIQLIATISESMFYTPEIKEEVHQSEEQDGYGLPKNFEIRMAAKQKYIYKSYRENKLTEVLPDFKGNYYNIEDTVHPMEWIITDEKKEIAGYLCTKATTHFRGRNYEAWFSPEVPFSTGPWKLGGLPGLIFEAREENGLIEFILQTLTLSEEKVAIKLPDFKTDPISHTAYLDTYLDQLEEYYAFKEAQLRKKGSNMKISVDRKAIQLLEIYEPTDN